VRGSQRNPGACWEEFRGRLGPRDEPGGNGQPGNGPAYGQPCAMRKKKQASRRGRPIPGPKIHMPQIVTSNGAIRGHTAELAAIYLAGRRPATAKGLYGRAAGLRSTQAGQAQVRGAEITDPVVAVRSGGSVQHLGGHVGDPPA
jgi:hypothetical protein